MRHFFFVFLATYRSALLDLDFGSLQLVVAPIHSEAGLDDLSIGKFGVTCGFQNTCMQEDVRGACSLGQKAEAFLAAVPLDLDRNPIARWSDICPPQICNTDRDRALHTEEFS